MRTLISLDTIQTIARYEAKVLFRSWFFRIFSSLALFFLILVNVALFALPSTSRWMFFGIPTSI
ncbi:MAG: hypothetical protein DRG82_15555, partial [Deltaproteobacteria bacterium]